MGFLIWKHRPGSVQKIATVVRSLMWNCRFSGIQITNEFFAGNYSAHAPNTVTYPAKHPNVICVGACDRAGYTSGLSSVGREVEFLCPGEGVVSTNNMTSSKFITFHALTRILAQLSCSTAMPLRSVPREQKCSALVHYDCVPYRYATCRIVREPTVDGQDFSMI